MSPASLPLKNARRPPRSYVLRMISITVPCHISQTAQHGTAHAEAPLHRSTAMCCDRMHTLFPVIICILMLSKGAVAVLLMAPGGRAPHQIAGRGRAAWLTIAPHICQMLHSLHSSRTAGQGTRRCIGSGVGTCKCPSQKPPDVCRPAHHVLPYGIPDLCTECCKTIVLPS